MRELKSDAGRGAGDHAKCLVIFSPSCTWQFAQHRDLMLDHGDDLAGHRLEGQGWRRLVDRFGAVAVPQRAPRANRRSTRRQRFIRASSSVQRATRSSPGLSTILVTSFWESRNILWPSGKLEESADLGSGRSSVDTGGTPPVKETIKVSVDVNDDREGIVRATLAEAGGVLTNG